MKTAKFTPIYIGHRANEKNYDLIFKVHEGILTGSIGKCFRFVVEKRPKKISGVIEGEYFKRKRAMHRVYRSTVVIVIVIFINCLLF